ncbi:MAG: 2-hydroxyacyl-CoA dehydratase subunit D [Candidatus Helarchaeota archaeon]
MELFSINNLIKKAVENINQIKESGRLVVGIPQHGIIPDELFHAGGIFPLHLTLGGRAEQEIGDEYLSPTTCPFGRATIGCFDEKNELYSKIDYLLTGTFCNGVQNIGNYAKYFDLPVIKFITPHTTSNSAFTFFLDEILKLKVEIEKITGKKISKNEISKSIKLYNKVRKLLRELNLYRINIPSKIQGLELFYLVHKVFLLGPEIVIPELEQILSDIKDRDPIEKKARIFLTGSGICLEDNFYELIENECNGLIVGDDLWSGYDFYRVDIEENGDPIECMAKKYLLYNMCGRMIPDPRINYIFNIYRECKAQGIIYHILKYCDSYSGLKYEFKKSLDKKQIPVLELERDFAESNIGQFKTRIEAFLEMIQ